jgi:hypothetical protein
LSIVLGLAALVAVWFGIESYDSAHVGGLTGADAGAGAEAGTDAGADAGIDAGTGAGAGTGAATLSPHEREEAAKDELATARDALDRGDLDAAANALERAARFDPSNPDIETLRERVGSAAPDGG